MKKLVGLLGLVLVLFVPFVAQAQPETTPPVTTGAVEVVLWYYASPSGPLLIPGAREHPWRFGMFLTREQCVDSLRGLPGEFVLVPCVPALFRETTVTPWHGYTFYTGERPAFLRPPGP